VAGLFSAATTITDVFSFFLQRLNFWKVAFTVDSAPTINVASMIEGSRRTSITEVQAGSSWSSNQEVHIGLHNTYMICLWVSAENSWSKLGFFATCVKRFLQEVTWMQNESYPNSAGEHGGSICGFVSEQMCSRERTASLELQMHPPKVLHKFRFPN